MDSITIFAPTIKDGDVAQSVEQRTENPCVGGSIPSLTTSRRHVPCLFAFYTLIPTALAVTHQQTLKIA